MKRFDFHLPIYGWTITIATVKDKNDEQPVNDLFSEFGIDDDNAIDNVVNERFDGGDTYVNAGQRIGLILLYISKSNAMFHNVLNHEKRHLVDRIGAIHLILNEREAIAYLDGFVSENIYSNLDKIQ